MVTTVGTLFYEGPMQAIVHHWRKANVGDYVQKQWFVAETLSSSVTVLFLSPVFSVEINKGITFRETCAHFEESLFLNYCAWMISLLMLFDW